MAPIQRNCNLELYFWIFFCYEEDKLLLFFQTSICARGKSLEKMKPTSTRRVTSAQIHKAKKAVSKNATNLPHPVLKDKQFRHLLRII